MSIMAAENYEIIMAPAENNEIIMAPVEEAGQQAPHQAGQENNEISREFIKKQLQFSHTKFGCLEMRAMDTK